MKIEKIVLILITSVVLTVGCATVKENKEENAEKEKTKQTEKLKNMIVDLFSTLSLSPEEQDKVWDMLNDSTLLTMQDTINVLTNYYSNSNYYKEQLIYKKELMSMAMNEANQTCKKMISVFPNPTSSSATININKNLSVYKSFQYKLIFDEKIFMKIIY